MAERLSRKALYDLVWSEPVKKLAARFGVSDVGLKKACARVAIPTPDRGYWAKKEAGQETIQAIFPIRPPGMEEEISIGGGTNRGYGYGNGYGYWNEDELLDPIGPPPEFIEPIEAVNARISEKVGRVAVPHTVRNWHPAVEGLLKEDEKRREKQAADPYPSSWNNPLFDAPSERRRLRILNSLFFAVAKMNGRPWVHREGREIRISFFQQHVHLSLDRPKGSNRRGQSVNTTTESRDTKLCLSILSGWGSDSVLTSWQDSDAQKLESQLTDIAIQVILRAEIQLRESAVRHYEWRVRRKAGIEEERRKQKLEAERAERERLRRIEQGRVNRLLKDAVAFQQAGAIRQYVDAIQSSEARATTSASEFEQWRQWALAQADRIDPAVGGKFLKAAEDEDDSAGKQSVATSG